MNMHANRPREVAGRLRALARASDTYRPPLGLYGLASDRPIGRCEGCNNHLSAHFPHRLPDVQIKNAIITRSREIRDYLLAILRIWDSLAFNQRLRSCTIDFAKLS